MYPKTIEFINYMCQQEIIPGANFMFYKQGKEQSAYIGYRQIVPKRVETTEDTLYDMASLTKVVMTNTIVLKLLEEGTINLDSSLKKYLPSWHEDSVTLRHLLTHTSGINGYINNRDELSANELKTALLNLPVNKEKLGVEKVYTDTGTLLIGFMLEELLKNNLHDLFSQVVLHPLNMSQSGFTNINPCLCAPTELTEKRGLIIGEVHDPKAFKLQEHCGSAGLFSNIQDTWQFVQMMLNRGQLANGGRFLEKQTIDMLLQDCTPSKKLSRSIGWDLKYHFSDNHPMLFHTGYTGTFILIDVIGQEAFIFLSNRVHPVDNKKQYLHARDELLHIYQKEQTN